MLTEWLDWRKNTEQMGVLEAAFCGPHSPPAGVTGVGSTCFQRSIRHRGGRFRHQLLLSLACIYMISDSF